MLKIGLIGCGKISQVRHAPEYAENPDCELAGYFDVLPENAALLAKEYGGIVYSSQEELLHSGLDAVSVCVANVAHGPVSVQALNAGLHVLCEKPMATSVAECEEMIAAARANKKVLMIGQNQRFAAAHQKARALVEEGAIGRILSFRTTFGHPGPEGWTGQANSWFFDKKLASFGAMADLGVHKTDLLHYLLGEKITKAEARVMTLDKKFPDGSPITVDDNAFCIYTTENNIVGTMHVSWTFYGEEDNSTILYGTEGVLRCYDDPEYSLILEKRGGETQRFALDKLTSNKEQTSGGRTSTGVIDAFVDTVLGRRENPIPGEEASKAMRVVLAAEASSACGCTRDVEY